MCNNQWRLNYFILHIKTFRVKVNNIIGIFPLPRNHENFYPLRSISLILTFSYHNSEAKATIIHYILRNDSIINAFRRSTMILDNKYKSAELEMSNETDRDEIRGISRLEKPILTYNSNKFSPRISLRPDTSRFALHIRTHTHTHIYKTRSTIH